MPLKIRIISVAQLRSIAFYRDWIPASRHLCDHLLTSPECYAWAILNPEIEEIVDPESDVSRFRLAKQIWKDEGESGQALYDIYADEVEKELNDAFQLNWKADAKNKVILAMGTSGILVVLKTGNVRVVKTAFIAGAGMPAMYRFQYPESIANRRANPIPRETSRIKSAQCKKKNRKNSSAFHQDNLSHEERVYLRLFKKSHRFVRKCRVDSVNSFESRFSAQPVGNHQKSDYWKLKECLPDGKMDFETWKSIRRKVRSCGVLHAT